ncbi:TIGR03943 family putative permease subunit [Gracilibacillus kekensis]|uniref:Putative membrane protein n=1 Tax=Gracilibacillus kekensis TaxID=1027249 RepID=A0A1M7PYC2_9BACI|nr:TIGR03943 family protein [Gracilibacillus kekensis]SHN22809.1 putative membrane protein [Gracilibacillus kekensis]
MKINGQQLGRAIILLFFTVFIYQLHVSEDILKLINPKYETLSKIGAGLFLLLFLAQMHRVFTFQEKEDNHQHHHYAHEHSHDHGDQPLTLKKVISYIVIIFPLFTGILVPLSSLDASIAKNKGATLSITNTAENSGKENVTPNEEDQQDVIDHNAIDPNIYKNKISKKDYDQLRDNVVNQSHIMMDDTLFSTYYQEIMQNAQQLEGIEVTLAGFVYREADFSPQQLVIGRFLVTHCVADASLIGFLTEFDQPMTLDDNTWVEITGTITLTEYQGAELPLIQVKDAHIIEEPDQPYVYPVNIEIIE